MLPTHVISPPINSTRCYSRELTIQIVLTLLLEHRAHRLFSLGLESFIRILVDRNLSLLRSCFWSVGRGPLLLLHLIAPFFQLVFSGVPFSFFALQYGSLSSVCCWSSLFSPTFPPITCLADFFLISPRWVSLLRGLGAMPLVPRCCPPGPRLEFSGYLSFVFLSRSGVRFFRAVRFATPIPGPGALVKLVYASCLSGLVFLSPVTVPLAVTSRPLF